MSGPNVVALVLFALIAGAQAGYLFQTWTAHYRHMEAMTARYQAERAYLEARTAEMLADVKQYGKEVARQVARSNKNKR